MNNSISERFSLVRKQTVELIEPLHPEDTVVQPVMDASPPKWHLAHTTWFFENFILKKFIPALKPFNKEFDFLFNSYYEGQGSRAKRDMRGFHTRPLLSEVLEYREDIDSQMLNLLMTKREDKDLNELVELGIQHEQQHQELLITDLKFTWGFSPLHPVYQQHDEIIIENTSKMAWLPIEEGIYETGYSGKGFYFDNESPRYKTYLNKFEIASRPVTVGEYLDFIDSGAYQQWKFWLHEGWQWINKNDITAPEYWKLIDNEWHIYTLNGLKKLNLNDTLTHISFYEADAFARWRGLRLPTEQEWEVAAEIYGLKDQNSNFLDKKLFHPTVVSKNDKAFLGQVWEWTNSAYLPYPGFKPWDGDIAEYNGKFMISQMVLRGGSCVTPANHIRLSYRNFFHPWLRWQFTGIRLAKD